MLNTYVPVPSASGGIEYTRHLVKYLSRRDDVELHILTLAKNIHYEKDDIELLTLHRIEKPFGYPLSFPLANLYLRHEIERIHPDIVHAIGAGAIYSPAAASVRHEYPTILTAFSFGVRGIKFSSRIQGIKYLLVGKRNEKYALSKIPNIILASANNRKIISGVTNSKIYIVPYGVEFQEIQRIVPCLDENPDALFIGRLAKEKGVDILIKALPMVLRLIPNLVGYLVGPGPQEKELKNLVKRLGLENSVKFLGFIPDEEKFQYYKACRVVVVPSRWDFSPITIYEAMACGKPVIASNVTNSEILEDGITGLLFESENVEDLADKIIVLLKDEKLREEIGKAAKEKVKQYDWGKVAERYIGIYKEVIADFHERKAKSKKGRKIL